MKKANKFVRTNASAHQSFMTPMRFSAWVRFDQRHELKNTNFPGVYAIAISARNIAGTPFRWTKDIVYFGVSRSVNGLQRRLKEFNNTIRGKTGHGGAQRFRPKYPDGNALAKKLYVAVCPFKCEVSLNSPEGLRGIGDVLRAEYLALAKYFTLFQRLPEFNDPERSPKEIKL